MQPGFGSGFGPAHPGLFETYLNDILASDFGHPDADMITRLFKGLVTHPAHPSAPVVAYFALHFLLRLSFRLPGGYVAQHPADLIGA